jgi:hypothetical protein
VCAGFWSLSSAAVGRFWELAGKKICQKRSFHHLFIQAG